MKGKSMDEVFTCGCGFNTWVIGTTSIRCSQCGFGLSFINHYIIIIGGHEAGLPEINRRISVEWHNKQIAQQNMHPTLSKRGDSARSRVRKNKKVLPAVSG